MIIDSFYSDIYLDPAMPSEFCEYSDSEGPRGDFQGAIDEDLLKLKTEEASRKNEEKAARKEKLFDLIAKSDVENLKKEALEEGLVDDDVRSQAWPLLLGLKDLPDWEPIDNDELQKHPEYNQVVLDVNRSLKRFPPSIEDSRRIAIQDELIVTILSILYRNKGLHYYQGFHDVAVTILLVVKSKTAGHIIEKISTEHLKPFLEPTMERTGRLLEYIYPLLEKLDYDLYEHLDQSGVGTVFCLPWFITWFSHTIETYDLLMRLFDYFIAYEYDPDTEYLLPLYLIVRIIEHRKNDVLETECEMAALHSLFYEPLDTLNFEDLLKKADKLYRAHPPVTLKDEVEKRMRERELRMKNEDEYRRAMRNKRLARKTSKLPRFSRVIFIGVISFAVVLTSMYFMRVKPSSFSYSLMRLQSFLRNQSYLWTFREDLEEK